MRTWIALLVVLVALGAVLVFGLDLLGTEEEADSDSTPIGNGEDPGEEGETPTLRPTPPVSAAPPSTQPALEEFPVREELRVLLLAGVPQRFNLFLARHLQGHPKVTVVSWVAPFPEGADPAGLPDAGVLPGLLGTPPRGVTFDDEKIDVLVLHDIDPGVLDRDFWLEVSERVQKGQLGLLAIPGPLRGSAMLGHEVLARLFPVAKARALEGQPVPGTFRGQVPFTVTDAGKRHAATRLVSWPGWSGRIWISRGLLERPWGTKFCYPVEKLAPGAQELLRIQPAQGDPWPGMVAGDPGIGRVLWFGAWDLGSRHAYGDPRIVQDWQVLVRNWITWLAGRVEE